MEHESYYVLAGKFAVALAILPIIMFPVHLLCALWPWLFWTVFGVGEALFPFLPDAWTHIGYWQIVGLLLVCQFIRWIIVYPVKANV